MAISAALRVLGSAVVTAVLSAATAQRGTVLAYTQRAWSVPLAANAAAFISSVTPSEGLIMSQLHKSVVDNLPAFETNFAAGVDARLAALFDWGVRQGTALAANLAKTAQ